MLRKEKAASGDSLFTESLQHCYLAGIQACSDFLTIVTHEGEPGLNLPTTERGHIQRTRTGAALTLTYSIAKKLH